MKCLLFLDLVLARTISYQRILLYFLLYAEILKSDLTNFAKQNRIVSCHALKPPQMPINRAFVRVFMSVIQYFVLCVFLLFFLFVQNHSASY